MSNKTTTTALASFLMFMMLVFSGCIQEPVTNENASVSTNNESEIAQNDTVQPPVGCYHNNPPCDDDYVCENNSCVLKSGCQYKNPSCNDEEDCINNSCVLKSGCNYDNPKCDSDHNCINNSCVLKSGCEYDNPSCSPDYDCMENSCVLKSGCLYDNPQCGMEYDCIDNACVLKSGCQYDNPSCDDDYECINSVCVLKQGCQYNNPSCGYGFRCLGNTCVNQECPIPSDLYSYTEEMQGSYGSPTAYSYYPCPDSNDTCYRIVNTSGWYAYPPTTYKVYQRPGASLRVVCQLPCPVSDTTLEKQYVAIERAMENLTTITGIGFVDRYVPIDFHFTSDAICGNYTSGYTGDYSRLQASDKGVACIFDYEKNNQIVPFDEDNACNPAGVLLETHEAGHALFEDTAISYDIQESFVKMLSFYIAGYYNGGDISNKNAFTFAISACDDRMKIYAPLNYQLCKMYDIDVDSYGMIFTTVNSRRTVGLHVDDQIFKSIVDDVAGQDTNEAFVKSGILIST